MISAHARAEEAVVNTPPTFVVYCFDTSRDMVTRVLTSECSGQVISEEAARKIEERRLHRMSLLLNEQEAVSADGPRMASLGTAFYVDPAGTLLTNFHVVDGCKAMHLRDSAGRQEMATVFATDVTDDLALLHAEQPSAVFAKLGSEDRLGQVSAIFIAGYPDQGLPPLQPLVSSGTLLRAGKDMHGDQMVFHAALRHGNSGGPIIDAEGSIIGIVKAKLNSATIFNNNGHMVNDIGIGVPLPVILSFLQTHGVHYQSIGFNPGMVIDPKVTEAPPYVTRAECYR